MFKKDVPLRQLEKRLDKLSSDVTKVIWWQVIIDLVLFIPTAGWVIFEKPFDASATKTTPVSDDWLGEVAKLERVSTAGSDFLASALNATGWLSIAEARRFVEIEKAEEKAEADGSTKGLVALKTRLEAKAAA